MKRNNLSAGRFAEQLSADFLRRNGYEIIERNWRAGHKEVDIIAQKGDVLVFVEVKARKNENLNVEQIVSFSKPLYLFDAAEIFVAERQLDLEIRFDLIIVSLKRKEILEHIENAFRPQW